MHLKLQSHGFFVYPNSDHERRLLEGFCMTLAQKEQVANPRTRQQETVIKAIFAVWKEARNEFGFMREDLNSFREYLEFAGFDIKTMTEEIRPINPGADIHSNMLEAFKPREKQIPAVDFLSDITKTNRVIDAATGFGKSFLGLNTSLNIGKRTAFLMEPSHIKTWINSIPEQTDMDAKKKCCIVQGSSSLKSLIAMQANGQNDYEMIFISAPTFREYCKAYESLDEFEYDVAPSDLFEYLGIGTLVRDEVHEAIHQVVRQTIYIHVPRIIFLSATLVSDNEFINRIYKKIFPLKDRWKSADNKHICVRSVNYDMYDPKRKVKFKGFRGYSHVKYEQSLMKDPKLMTQYKNLISVLVRNSYIKGYKDGLKCLLIFSTKEMCKQISGMLSQEYPDKTVGCYIHGAKDEELYDRDMVVSTPKGAGTGVDIPNLSVGWLTVGLSSTQLGRQIMGRLRPIKRYPDMDPMFLYLNNRSIPVHKQYDQKRKNDVRLRCKDLKTVNSGFILKAA